MTIPTELNAALAPTFELQRELGGGGMSRVFLAREVALDRLVVIKVLPADVLSGAAVTRFAREISVAARLQHPHVVPLLRAGDSPTTPWFAMPFVEGQSLRERLAHGDLPMAEAIRVLRDVASALAYAHERGIVHRDIKPENVLLSDGHAVVTDFGVAKAIADAAGPAVSTDVTSLTTAGLALGTLAYMPPEQIAGDPGVDHRADLYAFGMMAYETLVGRHPFAGRSAQQLIAAHMLEVPPELGNIRPEVPPLLRVLIARCVAKNVGERPGSAREILAQLDELTLGETSTAAARSRPPASSFRGMLPSPTLRHRVPVLLLVTLLGVIAAASAWWKGEPRSVTASSHVASRTRIAVLPFANLTQDTTLAAIGQVAANWVSQGLTQIDSVIVVNGYAIPRILDSRDPAAVKAAAAATGATQLVTGTISRDGDSLRVSASLIDVASGTTIRSTGVYTGPVASPMAVIAEVAERVKGGIDGRNDKMLSLVRVPRYDAYVRHQEAVGAFITNEKAARRLLTESITLDSTFVPNYIWLTASYVNAGLLDSAASMLAYVDQLPLTPSRYERSLLEYSRAVLDGDFDAVMRNADRFAAVDSFGVTLYLVGVHRLNHLEPTAALRALDVSDSSNVRIGWATQALVMADAYHLLGRHRDELMRLQRGRREFPRAGNITTWQLFAYGGLRDRAAALALADSLLQSRSQAMVRWVLLAGSEFCAHGDPQGCATLTARAMTAARAQNGTPLARAQNLALGFLQLGQPDSARAVLAPLLTEVALPLSARSLHAVAAARSGDPRPAEELLQRLQEVKVPFDHGDEAFLRGALLANLGRRDEAMKELTHAASRIMSRTVLMPSWHRDVTLTPLRGYAPFEQLIAPK